MGALWHELDGLGADAADVGSKAAWLDRLLGIGAAVPRAAVITVEAYRAFVRAPTLARSIASLPDEVDPHRLDEDAASVARAFSRAPMPAEVRRAIAEAFDAVAAGGTVAVRSSATAEDLDDASFAGQYATTLNVPRQDVEVAVRTCWASLWLPAARAYRAAHRISEASLAMAVVIQRMVPAEHSGVVFTVDPLDPDAARMRIEAVRGSGDALVSGTVTPAVYHVDRESGRPDPAGAPPFVERVAHAARTIERAFGGPQDIEWSAEDGRVLILQARPITTAPSAAVDDGFDSPPRSGVGFTSTGLAEMLPGVLPPLLWTINADLIEHGFAALFRRLGIDRGLSDEPMLARFRGRAALNLTRLKRAARRMPGGSAAEVELQYLHRVVTREPEPRAGITERLRRIGPGIRSVRLRKQLLLEAETTLRAVDLAIGLHPDLASMSADSLLSYRHGIRELARFGVATEVAVAAAASANYRSLERSLARSLGEEEAALSAQRLTAGHIGEQASGCGAVLSLWDVHCEYCQLPHVARAVYDGPVRGTEARLRAIGRDGDEFLRIVNDGLRSAGSAAVYAGETWEEERVSFWSALRRCRGLSLEAGPMAWMTEPGGQRDEELAALGDAIRGTWRWRVSRILTGQLVDLRWRLMRRMVSDAARFLKLREAVKSAVLRLGGEERRIIRELARRLRAQGLLARDGQERFLADEELESLARTRGGPDATTLRAREAAFVAMKAAPPLPLVFHGSPSVEEELELEGADVLHGWATSPGRVTARARVVRDPAEAHDLRPGEVLVGHATDPSWTPLFLTASAIVMELGGPLSHAAIVAREFKLPAVLNVQGAMRRITTGMLITVDGSRGTVEVAAERTGSEGGRVA